MSASALSVAYPDAQRAHIGTKDALNNEVKLAFGQGDLSWKPGHLRSAYGAICCHKFKPKNMTDDIFLAQILGHKLLGPNASLSVGQSTRISMSRMTNRETEQYLKLAGKRYWVIEHQCGRKCLALDLFQTVACGRLAAVTLF